MQVTMRGRIPPPIPSPSSQTRHDIALATAHVRGAGGGNKGRGRGRCTAAHLLFSFQLLGRACGGDLVGPVGHQQHRCLKLSHLHTPGAHFMAILPVCAHTDRGRSDTAQTVCNEQPPTRKCKLHQYTSSSTTAAGALQPGYLLSGECQARVCTK